MLLWAKMLLVAVVVFPVYELLQWSWVQSVSLLTQRLYMTICTT